MNDVKNLDTVIIGAGFTGLSAAYEIARAGKRVLVLERDAEIGGLAGSFTVAGTNLERFYHHWFTNDVHVMDLIKELGTQDNILLRPTRTGMYFANNFFKLSTPMDVLRFTPLGLIDRVRLGLMVLRARKVKHWRELEDLTAIAWLRKVGGDKVYEVVWEPLLKGKFGKYADEVSAVWFWNKLKLRGGSRAKGGGEQLAYYRGGFAELARHLADAARKAGAEIRTEAGVDRLIVENGAVVGVVSSGTEIRAATVLATAPLPAIADLVAPHADAAYTASLRRIKYLANVCMVLELDRSLSETYWLNVNDPGFPFVGVIEHTNFEPPETYKGRRIVYLSKYLPEEDKLYQMTADEMLAFSIPHLQRMFPAFNRSWVLAHHVWKARFSQPIVEKKYSTLIPAEDTPLRGLHIASMAQIYPEDRGTNYAIREGRSIGKRLAAR
jgi:protoporphyrinogen oxidase